MGIVISSWDENLQNVSTGEGALPMCKQEDLTALSEAKAVRVG
jgi:hypothetical protein